MSKTLHRNLQAKIATLQGTLLFASLYLVGPKKYNLVPALILLFVL
jgi:hypothetical protein